MENKINVAELLKDCPSDMELNCVMFENLYFDCIDDSLKNDPFPICCYYVNDNEARNRVRFSKYGTYLNLSNDKCVIFPKGKDTWEGFVPPYQFRDGDVIYVETDKNDWVSIFKEIYNHGIITYVDFSLNGVLNGEFFGIDSRASCLCAMCDIKEKRIATEEEKNKLFKKIKNKGYKWNAEKKCLEKLEDKFDINTLKPFDKVLVRNSNDLDWACDLFSHLRHEDSLLNRFRCIDMSYKYCIPFEGNEHLCGTSEDCDEFYKTWEE